MVFSNVQTWKQLPGKPTVTVSPVGIAQGFIKNGGSDYGPDTPGTTTSGIQEAINSLGDDTSYYLNNGGEVFLNYVAGVYTVSQPISSVGQFISIRGAPGAILQYSGTGACLTMDQSAAQSDTDPLYMGRPLIQGLGINLTGSGSSGSPVIGLKLVGIQNHGTFERVVVWSTNQAYQEGIHVEGYCQSPTFINSFVRLYGATNSYNWRFVSGTTGNVQQPQIIGGASMAGDVGVSLEEATTANIMGMLIQGNAVGLQWESPLNDVHSFRSVWFENNTTETLALSTMPAVFDGCHFTDTNGISTATRSLMITKDCFGIAPEPASSITVGTSPFTYTNTRLQPVMVVISGGTVTGVSIKRGSSSFSVGSGDQIVTLAGAWGGSLVGDSVTVTYTSAPTMELFPM